MDDLPIVVDMSWYRSEPITGGEPRMALLFYADGTVRFKHLCNRGQRGVIVQAPSLEDHQVDEKTLTVNPSLLCSDCKIHGYIKQGRWESV